MRSPIGGGKGGYGDEIGRQTDNLPTRTRPHPSGQSLNTNEIRGSQSIRIDSSQGSQNLIIHKNLITGEREILQRQTTSQTDFIALQTKVSNRIGAFSRRENKGIRTQTTC